MRETSGGAASCGGSFATDRTREAHSVRVPSGTALGEGAITSRITITVRDTSGGAASCGGPFATDRTREAHSVRVPSVTALGEGAITNRITITVRETSGGAASCGGSFAERCQGKNDNHRGAQRSDHGPAEAERLIQNALEALEWNEEELLAAKSVQSEKQAIAWLIKTHTAVSGTWIAERLRMGHRTNCSRAISRFRHGQEKNIRKMKEVMLKCTG